MKINVVYNTKIPNYEQILKTVCDELSKYSIEYKCFDLQEMQNFGDLTVTLGGDGTILRTARFYSEFNVPVLGINMGRLGFLSQPEVINVVIKAIAEGDYYVEDRLMLHSDKYLALNDVVVKGCNPSRSSVFTLEINGKDVCNYIADGIIISTPTGSTAYCLSSGGPVLYPTLDAIVIVPICPHTLNARPLVIPSTETLIIKTDDRLLSASIDGYTTIECVKQVKVKAADKKAKLAFLKERQFYSVIRNKLHWGTPPEVAS